MAELRVRMVFEQDEIVLGTTVVVLREDGRGRGSVFRQLGGIDVPIVVLRDWRPTLRVELARALGEAAAELAERLTPRTAQPGLWDALARVYLAKQHARRFQEQIVEQR